MQKFPSIIIVINVFTQSSLTIAEMKFIMRTARYTLLDLKGHEMFEGLGVDSIENKILKYKSNWLDHVSRMENTRILTLLISYKPRGN